MCTAIPVVLTGTNLGERHRYFNHSVTAAFEENTELSKILQAEEWSPIDRIYKIDLASKYRDVDYILDNLKDDDMLYVSRALKSHWLLESQYRDVINPRYLEEQIFPHMIQPAINKMRHWLQINLTDTTRCQQFYEYYNDQHEIAVKFLWHCSHDYILSEILYVLDKLTPQDLKILCETCPQVAKVYFYGLQTNKAALSRYLENEVSYFKSLRCVLKGNAPLYLDIVEKYFNVSKFELLSPAATHYIMKNYRDRFNAKQELYTSSILHLKTLANLLTAEEAKDLVLKLAKAEYLTSWFSYQRVEPLIKRVSVDERAAFRRQIFVDKAIGDKIKDWQYPTPIIFELERSDNKNIFLDKVHDPREYEYTIRDFRKMLKKRKYSRYEVCTEKTPLDILFDRYRYVSFIKSFIELSKKLLIESTIEGRMNIFLVLVSKSGGVPEQVNKVLKLLVEKHINEPSNVRAAVVRSLVKRACVWRLPDESWTRLLEFGRDLGLEGHHAELLCREGLHAVVLRHLINDVSLSSTLKTAFLNEISIFKEYKLNSEERSLVGPRLAKILLDSEPNTFLDVLAEYKLKVHEIADAEMTLVQKARTDSDFARRLFECRIGRRYLLKETFGLIDNNESFMNALKHDTSVLEKGKSFAALVTDRRPRHDRFLQSLGLYFSEPNGLAEQHKASLIDSMKLKPHPRFARTINILSRNASISNLTGLLDIEMTKNDKAQLAAAFRATAHKCRPILDIMSAAWRWLGAKAIANRALVCRAKDRGTYIKLLLQWRRTARIAIRVGLTMKSSNETFIAASKLRPAVALKMATKTYLGNKSIDPIVWEAIKNLIENLVTDKTSNSFLNLLKNNDSVPENIKSEYWQVVYILFLKSDKRKTLPILCRLENLLPLVDNDIMNNIIEQFLTEEMTYDQFVEYDYRTGENQGLHIRIMAKYLLTCKSEAEQIERLEKICDVFFDKAHVLNKGLDEEGRRGLYKCVYKFIRALKCNKVFLGNYISSLPVFERVLQKTKKLLPLEQYFALYVEIHLVMLYYKSLKQAIKKKQSIFDNLEQNLDKAIETVGLQLGQNIGVEVKELTTKYYFSMIDIYKNVLVGFLHDFEYEGCYNPIVLPMVKGLVNVEHTESLLLALHVFCAGECPQEYHEQILNKFKSFDNKVINMFLYAYMN